MMKRTERRSIVYFPEDLLVEILSRVPTKSLARLRSTSKRWNALVKDGRFAKKHYANSPNQSSLVLMVTNFRVDLVSVDYLHGKVTASAKITSQFNLQDHVSKQVDVCNAYHSDGLLVCITKDNRLVVWNPFSGQTRWIQARNSYNENDYYALGYDDKSPCYKILRMHRVVDDITVETESEVYDFASNSWRGIGSTTEWFIQQHRSRGMYVKGNTYWLALSKEPPLGHFLLCFDFSTERFQSLSLPSDINHQTLLGAVLSVTKEEQKLCMLATYGSDERFKSDVWIATKMESTGAMSWSKFRRFHSRIFMSVSVDHENKVLLCCNNLRVSNYNNILHIAGEDKYIHMDHDEESKRPLLLTYVPSLVQIQQGI
ncbi:F-box associated domain type 1 [Arabidopsis suecica]|uniref:F-box associated domain type 1 n=1 Tax=Arabidopsis suecica TaxID=45249 RepID=A0A8T1ZXC8_ARASU|nr:F-box associated domain type 1 [Arabidopsis suecica]